jgi:hypothetical protein
MQARRKRRSREDRELTHNAYVLSACVHVLVDLLGLRWGVHMCVRQVEDLFLSVEGKIVLD